MNSDGKIHSIVGKTIFTAALLGVLRTNNDVLEGYRLYRKLQTTVKRQAARLNVDQDPQYAPLKFAGHETADFFFVPKNSPYIGTRKTERTRRIASINASLITRFEGR